MGKSLVVYFSRTGEQYGVGVISKGNTAIMAEIIAQITNADLFEVKLQNDTYPEGYTPLTEVAKQEKKDNVRPAITGDVSNFDDYDTVFIGGPVWWSDLPMAMYTFIEKHNWTGKKVIPFATHEGSGIADIPENLQNAVKVSVSEGLALYGHELQKEPDIASKKIKAWLPQLGF